MNVLILLIVWFGNFHGSEEITTASKIKSEPRVCLSANEIELGKLIDSYRIANGLKPVPRSLALTKVAQAHVFDRAINFELNENDPCNMHSWSGKGKWKKCCYSSGSDGTCMWAKPQEIAGYTSDGYEIIMVRINSSDPTEEVEAADALQSWKKSSKHNDVVLNRKIWGRMDWQAMGIGIYQGYAAVWFGVQKDFSGSLEPCK